MSKKALKTWTCSRCKHKTPARNKYCLACGKEKRKKKPPAHRAALDYSYEWYVEFNEGEVCGVCGRSPSETRNLDRDHNHATGAPRGLLCHIHNRTLWNNADVTWARAVLAYLERAEANWHKIQALEPEDDECVASVILPDQKI